MTERGWRDAIVWDRMAVDQTFSPRIDQSPFTRQEWGLIMTAVELEIEGRGTSARLVADTSRVEEILPELDTIRQEMGSMMGSSARSSSGFFDSVKTALGLGRNGDAQDDSELAAATALADEYASQLQQHLEEEGKWEEVRRSAQPSPE